MRFLIVAILILSGCAPVRAAFEVGSADARSAALCGALVDVGVTGLISRWIGRPGIPSCTRVGALLEPVRPDSLRMPGPVVRFSGGELFGLAQAEQLGLDLNARLGSGAFGLRASSLGSSLYLERALALGVSRGLDADTKVVLVARALAVSGSRLDRLWSAAVDASVLRRVLGRIVMAARFENITRSSIGDSELPCSSRFGVVLSLESLLFAVSVESEPGFDPSLALGCEVAVSPRLVVRAGGSQAARLGFGLGFRAQRRADPGRFPSPALDLAWQWHPELGGSYFVSCGFEFR